MGFKIVLGQAHEYIMHDSRNYAKPERMHLMLCVLQNGVATCSVWYWVINCAQVCCVSTMSETAAFRSPVASRSMQPQILHFTVTNCSLVGKAILYSQHL